MTPRNTESPNDILVRRIRSLPRVAAQNRLMRTDDRQIALSMMFMAEPDRAFFFSMLPAAKGQRIREELQLQSRLKITYGQYKKAVTAVMEGVMHDRGGDSVKSYLRPVR